MKKWIALFLGLMALAYSSFLPLYLADRLDHEGSFEVSKAIYESGEGVEMTLKIPFALPYSSDWDESLEAEGLFQYEGKFYAAVSKKYEQDTIFVQYIQNNNAREIFNSLSNYFDVSDDIPQSNESGRLISKMLNLEYYQHQINSYNHSLEFRFMQHEANFRSSDLDYLNPILSVQGPPPKFI